MPCSTTPSAAAVPVCAYTSSVFDTLSDRLQAALGDVRGKGRLDEEADLQGDARDPARAARGRRQLPGRQGLRRRRPRARARTGRAPRSERRSAGRQDRPRGAHRADGLRELASSRSAGRRPSSCSAALQGSGKTTACAKLALHLRKEKQTPGLVAADLQRPAAIDQLEQLGRQIQIPVYRTDTQDAVAARRRGSRAREGRRLRRRDRRHRGPAADRRGADGRARARSRRRQAAQRAARARRDDGPGGGQRRAGVPGADRVRRRRPDEARRRRARRRGALGEGDHRASRSSTRRSARSSTSSRSSTPTGWRRGSSGWATS